ncbi:MAG: hypothetical protein A3B81_02255 [Candidatus Muproteobacteria bacterium RIFCSPHIGHO2_02_FULL_65_16]|uniref:PilZ domain-containing protein n=1 Tax=Candidatus Muproteobacteria bacterium RIFCSPHIGHO2_02_FULL_65_16 TaxID=1817766 RepID=A0A1F6U1P6_9PROT|nr:MAG: hypothetical protein A3B81_02255 [Candidatus Muproteobacteria bacterium RIFCSPHIGHO2_02_FULL_65_16]
MTTERRDTPRIPIALDAFLRDENSSFLRFLTRDISLDGAFVETGRAGLPGAGSLELALKLPTDTAGGPKLHRMHAQVTRLAPDGAGVVFDKVNTDAYAALLNLVFSRQPKGLY